MESRSEHGKLMQRAVRTWIRMELGRRNWKAADLSRATGMHSSSISRWLSDEKDLAITLEVLDRFAAGLGMTPEEILEKARSLMGEGGDGAA